MFFLHFCPRPNNKTKQTQTIELAQGAAPNKNKKTQQQSWPTRPPQTKNKKDKGLRAGPPGRPKRKKRNTIVITHRGESHTGL